jgi:hypothetical protein
MDADWEYSEELLAQSDKVRVHKVHFDNVGPNLEVTDECKVLVRVIVVQLCNGVLVGPPE